ALRVQQTRRLLKALNAAETARSALTELILSKTDQLAANLRHPTNENIRHDTGRGSSFAPVSRDRKALTGALFEACGDKSPSLLERAEADVPLIELTLFTKQGGPLTKFISLDSVNNALLSDSSDCLMSAGFAERAEFHDLMGFAEFITNFRPNQALATGALRA